LELHGINRHINLDLACWVTKENKVIQAIPGRGSETDRGNADKAFSCLKLTFRTHFASSGQLAF
jgi:hypothetical protein